MNPLEDTRNTHTFIGMELDVNADTDAERQRAERDVPFHLTWVVRIRPQPADGSRVRRRPVLGRINELRCRRHGT